MKKIRSMILIIFVLVVLCFAVNKYVKHHEYLMEKSIDIEEYLEHKYGQEINVEDISYGDILIAKCYPVENSGLKFDVIYWMNTNERYSDAGTFVDTYIQTKLARDAKNMIDNIIKNNGIEANVECRWAMDVSEKIMSEKLEDLYNKKGYMLSWEDDIPEIHMMSNIISDSIDIDTAKGLVEQIKNLLTCGWNITIFNSNQDIVFQEKTY